jgi:protein-histidine pros-kinase
MTGRRTRERAAIRHAADDAPPCYVPEDFGVGRLFWAIRDAVIVADAGSGAIVLWNPAAETLFGYAPEEVIGRPIELLVPAPFKDRHRAGLARYLTTGHGALIDSGAPVELLARRKDGTQVAIELSLTPLPDIDIPGTFVLALIRDAAGRAREARFRALFTGVADAILVAAADRTYLDANPAAEELLGYSRDELIGMRIDDIVKADAGDWTEAEFTRYLDDGRWQGELVLRRKDGTEVPVEARASVVTLATGAVYLAAVRDISERRQLEQLRRDFLAMVTHDLRTPLTTVRGYAQLLHRRAVYQAEPVVALISEAERMQRLLDDLADIVRLEGGNLPLRRAPTDLVDLARRAAAEAERMSRDHRISVDAGDLVVVGQWDWDRLGQVLANLLGNAVKYSPAGGRVVVQIEATDGGARLRVRDEGPGIVPEHLPKLFERFYRAGGTGAGGLGLGLYISRMLVEAHGGTIAAESEPGAGSTFTVTLPLAT